GRKPWRRGCPPGSWPGCAPPRPRGRAGSGREARRTRRATAAARTRATGELGRGASRVTRLREAEADPTDGVDEARIGGVVAELLAQPADVRVERARGTEPVLVPDLLHERLTADDAAGTLHERGEEVELLAAQLDLRPVEGHTPRREIELQSLHARDTLTGGRAASAPQHRADARDHLGAAEWLDHVVVGAELEADDAVGLCPARGEHDDRGGGVAADLAGDVAAVAVGKHQVEQDEVGVDRAGEPQRLSGGRRHHGLEALALERVGERLGDRAFVLYEKDAWPRLHSLTVGVRSALRPRLDVLLTIVFPLLCPGLPGPWRAAATIDSRTRQEARQT